MAWHYNTYSVALRSLQARRNESYNARAIVLNDRLGVMFATLDSSLEVVRVQAREISRDLSSSQLSRSSLLLLDEM